jgi:hypothetical protein
MASKRRQGLRFDWYPKVNQPFVDEIVNDVLNAIEATRTSTRGISAPQALKRTEETTQIAKQVISALYIAFVGIPIKPKPISFPKTKGSYSTTSSDPDKIHCSATYALEVFNALKKRRWITETKGIEAVGYTRITPRGDLAKQLNAIGLRWFKQEPRPLTKLVVLRDYDDLSKPKKQRNKINLPVPETAEVNRYRACLAEYNEFITNHCIAFDLDDEQLNRVAAVAMKGKDKADLEELDDTEAELDCIDLSRVQLRRIFARGSMEKGGRFYGGWWQSIPSLYRPHITIDGYKTCEVDYSAMSVRVIYALKGLDLPLDEDPYDIGLEDWIGTKDPRRKPIKRYINAVLNDEQGRYRLSSDEQKLSGLTYKELRASFHKKHFKIADVLNTDIGLTTQFKDSQIAVTIMQAMLTDGIVVLPIHDSFIVRAGYEQWLSKVMLKSFYEVLVAEGIVDVDTSRLKEHFELEKSEVNTLVDDFEGNITNTDELYKDLVRPRTALENYAAYWEQWRHDS